LPTYLLLVCPDASNTKNETAIVKKKRKGRRNGRDGTFKIMLTSLFSEATFGDLDAFGDISRKTRQDKDKTKTRQGRKKTSQKQDKDKTKQRQDKTRQDKTRQDKTRQDKTRQDNTRQDNTRQDNTIRDKTK
jgi:hypothetical protein